MTQMKTSALKTVAIMLVFCLVLSTTGCGGKKKIRNYRGKLNTILQTMQDQPTALQGAIDKLNSAVSSRDQQAYEEGMASLQETTQSMIDNYHALANVAAPDDFKEQQKQLKTYADAIELMLSDSVRLYTVCGEMVNLGYLTDDSADQVAVIQSEIEALTPSMQAFDDLLNEVLGYTEPAAEEALEGEASMETEDGAQETEESTGEAEGNN